MVQFEMVEHHGLDGLIAGYLFKPGEELFCEFFLHSVDDRHPFCALNCIGVISGSVCCFED